MKKVGLAACIYQKNYGSVLQAFATKEYIETLGKKCQVIDYRSLKDVKKRRMLFFLKEAFNWNYSKSKLPMFVQQCYLKFGHNKYTSEVKERYRKFDEFVRKNFDISTGFNDLSKLQKYSSDQYETLVVGSDQLWLPVNVAAGFYTLGFAVGEMNKVSYATSFGQEFIPDSMTGIYKSFLDKLNFISVREQNGADIVKNVSDQTACVVCDPVFLLSKDEWGSLAGNKPIISGDYALCYFLGKHKTEYLKVRKYCTNKGYRMVVISNVERSCPEEKTGDNVVVSASPEDFLNLIANASVVCTDSFHCCAFSIIFGKNFIPFMRYSLQDKYSTNGRVKELLASFGYKCDVDNEDNLDERICFSNSQLDDIMNRKRQDADTYLRKALSI